MAISRENTNFAALKVRSPKGVPHFTLINTCYDRQKTCREFGNAEGVWIEDCAELSRFIESRLDRDREDFELEVGSAGLGQPFRVKKQYEIHVGQPVETQTRDGHKWQGTLMEVTEDGFTLEVEQKVKPEGAKRAHKERVGMHFTFEEVAYTKYLIKVK